MRPQGHKATNSYMLITISAPSTDEEPYMLISLSKTGAIQTRR